MGEKNGHATGTGGLSGWKCWLVGQRLWERAAVDELAKKFTAAELSAVADGGAADGMMEKYWAAHEEGRPVEKALAELVARVRTWLERGG